MEQGEEEEEEEEEMEFGAPILQRGKAKTVMFFSPPPSCSLDEVKMRKEGQGREAATKHSQSFLA